MRNTYENINPYMENLRVLTFQESIYEKPDTIRSKVQNLDNLGSRLLECDSTLLRL